MTQVSISHLQKLNKQWDYSLAAISNRQAPAIENFLIYLISIGV